MGLEMLQMQNKLLERLNPSTSQFHETNRRLGWGFAAMLAYLLVGAAVFAIIEAPRERIELDAYEEYRAEWTSRLARKGFNDAEIDRLFANIRDSALNGIWRERNVTSDSNWTFGRAFFFAAALISTVGYGHASPRTPYGKLFTICYCIVGIPLALALISALAIRLRSPSAWLREKMNVRLGHVFHTHYLQFIHMAALVGAILLVAFVIPSLIFTSIEDDWTFLDAFYFCFVSLSTIGLGEQIPGDQPDQPLRGLYKMLTAVYIISGLCCMMLLLSTLYSLPQFNLVRFFVTTTTDESAAQGGGRTGTDSERKPINIVGLNRFASVHLVSKTPLKRPKATTKPALSTTAEWHHATGGTSSRTECPLASGPQHLQCHRVLLLTATCLKEPSESLE